MPTSGKLAPKARHVQDSPEALLELLKTVAYQNYILRFAFVMFENYYDDDDDDDDV